MRLHAIGALIALSVSALAATSPRQRDYDLFDYYALHLEPRQSPKDVARHLGLELDGPLGELEHHFVFRSARSDKDIVKEAVRDHRIRKRTVPAYSNDLLDDILLSQKQKLKPRMEKRGPIPGPTPIDTRQQGAAVSDYDSKTTADDKAAVALRAEIAKKLDIHDPIFDEQWHLYNARQKGHDINVTGVWLDGITGKGATVCIVDDGLDMDSEDIKDNYFAEGSYDFNDKVEAPKPQLDDDRHGTRCAGEVAAVKNNVCGIGVAYNARISGIRILSKAISDADEAEAMIYGYQENDIYSCSWGPPDNGQEMGAPGILIKRAMMQAIQKGRHSLGTIYVFAAGNGAASEDNCNFDGYTNSIYSVTIGAIDRAGHHPYYSEKCSAQLAVTYSSGAGDAIHTTDIGPHSCVSTHGGTSAAGPLAAGIYALMLEARPELTWRDIQWITVLTAVPVVSVPVDSQETALGKNFSHQFGYGKLDAWAMVETAKTFERVKPQAWYFSPWQHIRHTIPQGKKGLTSTFTVTKDALANANFQRVEHVTVTMNINHTRRGDLMVDLRSPTGMISHLSTPRRLDEARSGYVDWTFMSVAHWGESGEGDWTVIVKDVLENDHNGTLIDWKLNLFGECDNPTYQKLLPLPTEHDDDDHDREGGVASTKSVDVPTQTGSLPGNPTDHPHRPVNAKPSDATHAFDPPATATGVWGSYDSNLASATSYPSGYPEPPSKEEDGKNDSFLPSPFPTFGVSKRTQIWIYGAAGLIIVFCISLAVYFYLARRKRRRAAMREQYEFEMLNDDDDDDERQGLTGGAKGRNKKRRAGELYDAFAGESDEEIFSDEEEFSEKYEDFSHEDKTRAPGEAARHDG